MFLKPRPITIRLAEDNDRQNLANLIHFETQVHRHLDWRPPVEWLGHLPFLIAEQNGRLVAALACPPDPPQVAWIRLFVVASGLGIRPAWEALWPEARRLLIEKTSSQMAAAIPLQHWFRDLLDKAGFQFTHNVLVLAWTAGRLPPEGRGSRVVIRAMKPEDLETVQTIDQSSFGNVWQNSLEGIELAYHQAAVATVAEVEGKICGYQVSTATAMGGHLARLAVLPEAQGKGIGYVLVRDLLFQFLQRGAFTVTVNTQHDNRISLSLYKKAGFQLTGEEYPVYQLSLEP